jgi:adenine-specific DNA-methyltransferase
MSSIAPTELADSLRRDINGELDDTRSRLGQFMTPPEVAAFMASMIRCRRSSIEILDPGAGVGALTAAVVDRLLARKNPPKEIIATCYEVDDRLCLALAKTLALCQQRCAERGVAFTPDLRDEDYIHAQTKPGAPLFGETSTGSYDIVILNPPYRKINTNSTERLALRRVGIEVSNLYSAFMLLAARQLSDGGDFVSITPRSFCNGPYFRPFRQQLFRLLDLRRVHVYESRTTTFKDDAVLQENLIVSAVRSARQAQQVEVSSTLADGRMTRRRVPAEQLVQPGDPDVVLHIHTDQGDDQILEQLGSLPDTLASLGLTVSTGRVVDFRARKHLRADPEPDTVPLIFAVHIREGQIKWPNGQRRKPNAIAANPDTEKLLVPRGCYVLTKRFSAKEERRRVVAGLLDPTVVDAPALGFDNKTNYIHLGGGGLDADIARGLTVYLNSTAVDQYFRTFSGHTQVNATDLRRMPFPSRDQLRRLAKARSLADQAAVDAAVARLF